MKVIVDRDLCQGHGVCEGEAPNVFTVNDDGELSVAADQPPDSEYDNVEKAVRYCPTGALRVVEQ